MKQLRTNSQCCCRSSRDDESQGDSNSIVNQKAYLGRYAKEHSFRNTEFFVDDGYTGANFQRPDWQRMMALVEDEKDRYGHHEGHEPHRPKLFGSWDVYRDHIPQGITMGSFAINSGGQR